MFNLTLLIQGLNFLIAYWLLSQFFFKPILNCIAQGVNKTNKINSDITHYRQILKDAYLSEKKLWQDTCHSFSKYTEFNYNIGIKPKGSNHSVLSIDVQAEVNEHEQAQLTQVLVNNIMAME